ncbi:MAG TPA: nucleotidyltransferase family protein [Gammaproteobacteria bacterium]|nr:nucleotidyltransferase family protein [Gammaproteobacteria bacterium]
MTVDNELRLALACARVRLGPRDDDELQACLDAPIDWDRLLRLAHWHGLRPLLHRHLAGHENVPRAAAVQLWAQAEAIARRNRFMRAELGRILALFDSAGIRALAYKGPTLALRAYAELALREFGDLDILVPRAQVQRARDALCAAGYVREYPLEPAIEEAFLDSQAQYHLVVRAPGEGPLVELHWKSDPDYPVERLDDESWWACAGRIDGLPTLADEDLLLVLCIHGSKHSWACLGWLVDVAEVLRSRCDVDWQRFAERALAMGSARRVGAGLRLASDLLGAPLPEPAAALARRPDVERILPALRAAMLAVEPAPLSPWQGLRQQWALHGTPTHAIRNIFRSLCLPSLVEWTRWPLPRALFFAYPVLRLGRLSGKYLRRGVAAASRGRRLQS